MRGGIFILAAACAVQEPGAVLEPLNVRCESGEGTYADYTMEWTGDATRFHAVRAIVKDSRTGAVWVGPPSATYEPELWSAGPPCHAVSAVAVVGFDSDSQVF